MRSTLGTSEHNSGASICFYAASKNVSEELVMITPRHFLGLKESAGLYMPSVLSNSFKQHAQNFTAERTSPPWGGGSSEFNNQAQLIFGRRKGKLGTL